MFWIALLLAPAPTLPEVPAPTAETLDWEAAPGCPDVSWVRQRIDEFRGADSLAGFDARARISLRGTEFALSSHIETPAGESELKLADRECEPLAMAFALSVALALEPEVASESLEALLSAPPVPPEVAGPPPEPEPSPSPAPPPELGFDIVPVETVDRTPRRRVPARAWLQLSLAGGWGLTPGFDLPLRLQAGVRIASWEVSGGPVYLPPSFERRGDLTLLRTTALGAQARVARVLGAQGSRLSVPVYAHGEAGWIEGRGVDLEGARNANAAWWALGIGTGLRLALRGPVFAAFELDGQLQPGRPAFALSGPDGDIIHESSFFAFRAGLALGLRFDGAQNNSVARDQSRTATTRGM